MSLWHCHDRCSGERFEVNGSTESEIEKGVEEYIWLGIDADAGTVDYDVIATAIDGSEYSFSGSVQPGEEPAG
jgi:hypothetical protein